MTNKAIEVIKKLKSLGVLTATNIIIDYNVGDKTYKNFDEEKLNETFDYYSWNPYFDGDFNLDKAKERYKKYIK